MVNTLTRLKPIDAVNYNNSSRNDVSKAIGNLRTTASQSQVKLFASPVKTYDDLLKAYGLLYREYIARGYCFRSRSSLHYHAAALLPSACTLVVQDQLNMLGTLTLVGDSKIGLPMEKEFPNEIAEIRNSGRNIAEIGMLALDSALVPVHQFSLANFNKFAVLFHLFKVVLDFALFNQVTDFVIAVHPKHEALYRFLTFKPMGETRSYSGAQGNPALPLIGDTGIISDFFYNHLPSVLGESGAFLRDTTDMHKFIKRFKLQPEQVNDLLIWKNDMWYRLSQTEREYFLNCYGQKVSKQPVTEAMIYRYNLNPSLSPSLSFA